MKKKYMAPTMEMHKTVSTSLICLSELTSSKSTSSLDAGKRSADSRRIDVEDDIFDEFENGSIWDF